MKSISRITINFPVRQFKFTYNLYVLCQRKVLRLLIGGINSWKFFLWKANNIHQILLFIIEPDINTVSKLTEMDATEKTS